MRFGCTTDTRGLITNSQLICDFISNDAIHRAAQRRAQTPRQIALAPCFSHSTSMERVGHRTQARRASLRGHPFSLISCCDVIAALGEANCATPEEKALQGEACLINRIVPVWFTLLGRVTLDGAARTEVR